MIFMIKSSSKNIRALDNNSQYAFSIFKRMVSQMIPVVCIPHYHTLISSICLSICFPISVGVKIKANKWSLSDA